LLLARYATSVDARGPRRSRREHADRPLVEATGERGDDHRSPPWGAPEDVKKIFVTFCRMLPFSALPESAEGSFYYPQQVDPPGGTRTVSAGLIGVTRGCSKTPPIKQGIVNEVLKHLKVDS
jgi:hypothetical protein